MGTPAPDSPPPPGTAEHIRLSISPEALRMAQAGTPGALVDVVLACIEGRAAPGRSGWSNVRHLRWDLERVVSQRFEPAAIAGAVRRLVARGLVRSWCTGSGEMWVASTRVVTAPEPSHLGGRGSAAWMAARRSAG